MGDTGAFVYVVDDDVSAREGVARLIRSAGLMAKTFSSGEEFLAAPRIRAMTKKAATLREPPDLTFAGGRKQ